MASASPEKDALAGDIWSLELDIYELKAANRDTTEEEAKLAQLLLRQDELEHPELPEDPKAPTNSTTHPNMSGQIGGLSEEPLQQNASIEGRKRARSDRDESSASEPPHKSRRTTPLLWDSDDEMEDDVEIAVDRHSSTDGTQFGNMPSSNGQGQKQCETPEALQCTLYKHQLIALQWMTKQEEDASKKGGILADDMGLGKTLTAISLMVSRKAENPSSVKTNLIVAPLALLKQWQREIEQKIKPQHQLSIFVMHGSSKTDYAQLRKYDVVLTTYGKLTSEFNKMDAYIRKAKENKQNTSNDYLSRLCPITGPLSIFHRVILDEAQCIKNQQSKSAKAASQLKAEYRWCLSGTPMMNGPKELASLVHFLRIKPYDNINLYMSTFKILDPRSQSARSKSVRNTAGRKRALDILRALLSNIMLRRTKDEKIDGKPIVDLKEKVVVVDYAVFDDDELDFYRTLEKNSRVEFSKYYRAGQVGRNITKILILLLRLRQACCHPHLHLLDVESGDPNISDDKMIETAKSLGPEIVERAKQAENFQCSMCSDVRSTMNIMSPCGDYICTPCVDSQMDIAKQQNIAAGDSEGSLPKGTLKCPKCMEGSKVVTYDAFTRVHMPEKHEGGYLMNGPGDDSSDDDFDDDFDNDSEDVDDHGNLKGFVVNDDADDEYVDDNTMDNDIEMKGAFDMGMKDEFHDMEKSPESHKPQPKPKAKKQTLQLAGLREKAKNSQKARKRYMKELRKILLPSSKVTKCIEIISTIQKTTGEKIIIFSQWTFLLDILEIFITDQVKIGLCRFDGSMSATQRDDAANEFTTNPDKKVILVSLKAGNAGLNLTAASQVILMDPFWNPYIENQAIDRTYRIGQQRDVTVHRILVKETVEDRIVSIQDQKRHLVESALSNEKMARSVASLGTDDLRFIFGGSPRP